jgi:UPF0271 protein
MRQLDLNADVGEGLPDVDRVLMPLISSANIACGLHAGDPDTMRATVALASQHGVAVGAHPGYRDAEGFGRRPVKLTHSQVVDLLLYQLGALSAIAEAEGAPLDHVKPHGALYNQAEVDDELAAAIVDGIRIFDPRLRLVGRAGSAMQRVADSMGQAFTSEAFADRRYLPDGRLKSRSEAGAVLTDPEQLTEQVRLLVTHGEVLADDGSRLSVAFESLCLHSDTPGSVALAARVRQELDRLGVSVSAPHLLGVDTLPP